MNRHRAELEAMRGALDLAVTRLSEVSAEAAAARRERDQAVADRDQWRRQAQLLADRYDEAREEIRRESALKVRTEAE